MKKLFSIALLSLALAPMAQSKEITIYSARHYATDEQLYADFTKQTGITVNRIEADDAAVMERMSKEGKNSSADVVLMVDAARLWRAEQAGLFQPITSKIVNERIPAHLRGGDNPQQPTWVGLSTRARIIVYNPQQVAAEQVSSYEQLADPKNKGLVCTRSGSHPYMLSLVSALLAHHGEEKTTEWARGVVANMARAPKGGDTDQIKAVASGECGVALTNSYYLARLMASDKPEDQAVVAKLQFVWPNQQSYGTHTNIAGAALAQYAPHKAEAIAFIEYLTSDSAQQYFANGNNEWPAVESVQTDNSTLQKMGNFKADTSVSIATIGKNQIAAQRLLDKVGYK